MLDNYFGANRGLSKIVLTMDMIQSKRGQTRYPSLKCKAAQARHMAPFALHLANLHAHGDHRRPPFQFPPGHRLIASVAEHRARALNVFEGTSEFYQAIDVDDMSEHIAEAKAAMHKILDNLKVLSNMWLTACPPLLRSRQPWHVRQKAHMLVHLVEEQLELFGSPRQTWCYTDESFMHTLKRCASFCKHGSTLESTVLAKLRLAASVEHFMRD